MRCSKLMLVFFLMSGLLLTGCDQPTQRGDENHAGDHHDGDHHHDHDHDDHDHDSHQSELGPNKGHLIHLEPEDYVAEWKHYDGNSVIRVFVLGKDKKETPVAASVTITPDGGKSKDPFTLVAEQATDGKASAYMLDDQRLSIATTLGVSVSIEIDGKTYSGKIAPHQPHGDH